MAPVWLKRGLRSGAGSLRNRRGLGPGSGCRHPARRHCYTTRTGRPLIRKDVCRRDVQRQVELRRGYRERIDQEKVALIQVLAEIAGRQRKAIRAIQVGARNMGAALAGDQQMAIEGAAVGQVTCQGEASVR